MDYEGDEADRLYGPYFDTAEYWDSRAIEMESEFLQDLSAEYLSILQREYEYRTSEEAIIETIRCNEYEFDENGKLA